MKKTRHTPRSITLALLLAAIAAVSAVLAPAALAGSSASGTIYPYNKDEGIVLNYTISGIAVIEEIQEDGLRHYVRGIVHPGDKITIAVNGNGTTFSTWHYVNEDKDATLSVWLDGGGDANKKTVILPPGTSGSLSATYTVPKDATEFEVVGYIGNAWINPYGGGSRSLIVNGIFTVESKPAGAGTESGDDNEAGYTPGVEEKETKWTTIILVGAAIAGTLGGIAASLRYKASRKGDEQDSEEIIYVLNPSQEHYRLEENKPAILEVRAYRVSKEGQQLEQEAEISASLEPALQEYFNIQKTGTAGDCIFTINLLKMPPASKTDLQLHGIFPHGKAQAAIQLEFPLEFHIAPVDSPCIRYSEQQHCWQPPGLVAYFRPPAQNEPVKPGFYYGFQEPPLTFDPEILEVEEAYSSDDGLTYNFKLKMKEGIDLEDHFGKDLTDDSGRVSVRITVKDEAGNAYSAQSELQVRPELKLVAYAYNPQKGKAKSDRPETPYKGLKLEGNGFIADGKDQLPLMVFFIRSDKEPEQGLEHQSALDLVTIERISFAEGSFPDPEEDLANSVEGLHAYTVRSGNYTPYTKDALTEAELEVEATLKPGCPANLGLAGSANRIKIMPQYLQFHFYVVPGQFMGTSEAFAYVQLQPSKAAVPGVPLSLDVIQGALVLKNNDRDQETRDKEITISNEYVPLPLGTACWSLKYAGLNWDQLASVESEYKITCSGPDSDTGPIWQETITINVRENIDNLLGRFFDAADGLKLNNPHWQGRGLGRFPYFIRGALNNILSVLVTDLVPYRCLNIRDRIIAWLIGQSYYRKDDATGQIETMARMNGIEFEQYEITGWHVWAGIFLSGTEPGRAKALDPWWEQRWNDPSLKDHQNLITVYSELNWKLSERGLSVRAISAITAGVLALAVLLAPLLAGFGVILPAAGLAKLLIAGIGGAAVAVNAAEGVDPNAAINNPQDGRKKHYEPNWFKNFITSLSQKEE